MLRELIDHPPENRHTRYTWPRINPHMAATAASGLLAITQGAVGFLTAGWLGPHDRGVVVLASSVSSLLLLVAGLGMNTSARALLSGSDALSLSNFHSGALKLIGIEAAPIALTAAASLNLIAGKQSKATTILFALYCIGMTAGAVLRESLHGVGRHVLATSTDIVSALVTLSGATFARIHNTLTVSTLMGLMTIGAAAQCAIALCVAVIRPAKQDAARIAASELVRKSLPGVLLSVGFWFAWRGDRLILGMVSTPSEVGIYGFISTLVDIPWIIPGAISPILTRQVSQGATGSAANRLIARVVLATFAATVFIVALSYRIIPVFPGREYLAGFKALLILVPASIALSSGQMMIAVCVGLGHLSASARPALAAGVVMLATCPWLAWLYGATGCALSSLLAYLSMAVSAHLTMRHLRQNQGCPPPPEAVYDVECPL